MRVATPQALTRTQALTQEGCALSAARLADFSLCNSSTACLGILKSQVTIKLMWVPDDKRGTVEQQSKTTGTPPPGKLHVTVLKANSLRNPKDIIRSVATFVDFSAMRVAFGLIIGFLGLSFLFYWSYLGPRDETVNEEQAELIDKLHGGNGDWNAVNTMVFLITSFTTVGFGNHPSLMNTKSPCSYPSAALQTDDPASILLPKAARRAAACQECSKALNANRWVTPAENQANITVFEADMCQEFDCGGRQLDETTYPSTCLQANGNRNDPRCWIIADQSSIFHFGTLKYYQTHDTLKAQDYSLANMAESLTYLEIPGSLRDHSTFSEMEQRRGYRLPGQYRIPGQTPPCRVNTTGTHTDEWKFSCFAQFKLSCDDQLRLWKDQEEKKNVGKFFTVIFILVGIGVLGNALGTIGDQITNMVRQRCHDRLVRFMLRSDYFARECLCPQVRRVFGTVDTFLETGTPSQMQVRNFVARFVVSLLDFTTALCNFDRNNSVTTEMQLLR